MAANIPWGILAGRRRKRVLDPMAGSGTTLVVARATGHQAIGFDTDPLAILLSRVWSCNCEPERIVRAGKRTLKRAKKIASGKHAESWPAGADQETIAFVRYWFDARAGRRLWASGFPRNSNLLAISRRAQIGFCVVYRSSDSLPQLENEPPPGPAHSFKNIYLLAPTTTVTGTGH
jgi:hypothetical protein